MLLPTTTEVDSKYNREGQDNREAGRTTTQYEGGYAGHSSVLVVKAVGSKCHD